MLGKLKPTVLFLCAMAMAASAVIPAFARPITPAERRYHSYHGELPACEDPAVLQRIARHFHQAESEYWSSGLSIVSYDRIAETGYRANGLDYIPRRYCEAKAIMNDGKTRRVVYHVGEKLGVIGWGPGVEWCIVGLDRNYAWGRNCRAALP